MPVEKPNFGHFHEILPYSTGNKLVTKPIFQSNSIIVVCRMYRGKGFVLNVIGNEALLPTYCQLKTHFLPLWIQNGRPPGPQWVPTGRPVGTQWAPSGHPVGTQWAPSGHLVGANWHNTRLTGSIGAGL